MASNLPNSPIKVLIVEDEPDLRDILACVFQEEGAQVFKAENGIGATEILNREKIDFVLSDVRMPRMDGIQLLRFIQTQLPHPKPAVILASGYADLDSTEAQQMGAIDLLSKPFSIPELMKTVQSHFPFFVCRQKIS